MKVSWACYEPEKAPERPKSPEPPRAPEPPIPVQQSVPTPAREVQVTFREHDVAHELFKTGGTNTQIARHLCLSEDTVKTHMKRLLARTGEATRSELIVAHYQGRLRLVARATVGGVQYGMIKRRAKTMEDAL